ncbi:HigA family addiction module antitoxin [Thalassospira sp. MCCC 1A01428]|uniref:HigA family addiction module antitoxin n=1 Tax=Thalassospira sp. MCCC 1A01428 TaxID=1470575 RepID=UPI000A1E1760|nr:HigA family addiction module antitoxin [Thalassospira sp. MCCC 1A01428]OSQ41644.1 XRE family transcriptional regulator [Thalassospira sp. MCCC 1A01428]
MQADSPLHVNRRPTHPGKILREHYLAPLSITQIALAKYLGISTKHLSQIVNGHARIDSKLAAKIAKVLETTAQFWVNLQAKIDMWDAEQETVNWQPANVYPAK